MKEVVSVEVYTRLKHIQEACEKIMEYTARGRREFDTDEKIRIPIIHYISVIGEAAKLHNIPKDFQVRHQEIAWRDWVHQRNILVHNYDSVNPNLVWQTATKDVPDLLVKITSILSSVEVESGGN